MINRIKTLFSKAITDHPERQGVFDPITGAAELDYDASQPTLYVTDEFGNNPTPFGRGLVRTPLIVDSDQNQSRSIRNHLLDPNRPQGELVVKAMGDQGLDGAHQLYHISGFDSTTNTSCPYRKTYGSPAQHTTILFQNGNPEELGQNGITMEALLGIVEHRLLGIQSGPYPSEHNDQALHHVRRALKALHTRTKSGI